MFIAILTYKKPLGEVDKYLQAHRDYLAMPYISIESGKLTAEHTEHKKELIERLTATASEITHIPVLLLMSWLNYWN